MKLSQDKEMNKGTLKYGTETTLWIRSLEIQVMV